MTATEVLRTICDRQGVDVLSDGKQLLGLFEDYSRGKLRPQAHALRVLVECGGNKRIAQMRNAPALQQKTGLHRLMQEMVTEYGLQETMAREICGAVWEAFCGVEAPLSQIAAQEPEKRPESAPEKIKEEQNPEETLPTSKETPPKSEPPVKRQKTIGQLKEAYNQKDKKTRKLIRCGALSIIGDIITAMGLLFPVGESYQIPWWVVLSLPVFSAGTICTTYVVLTGRQKRVKSQLLGTLCLFGHALWYLLRFFHLFMSVFAGWAYDIVPIIPTVMVVICIYSRGKVMFYEIDHPFIDIKVGKQFWRWPLYLAFAALRPSGIFQRQWQNNKRSDKKWMDNYAPGRLSRHRRRFLTGWFPCWAQVGRERCTMWSPGDSTRR